MRRVPSLSQRLLAGLLIVTFAYWAVIVWLTIRDTVEQTSALFDADLAQTGLALLRVTDPDDNDPVTIPKGGEPPPVSEMFHLWKRALPERLARLRSKGKLEEGTVVSDESIHSMQQEYEKNLRYQIWDRHSTLLLRSSNAPKTMITTELGYSQTVDDEGQTWRHFAIEDKHGDFRVVVGEAHELRNGLVQRISMHLVTPLLLGMPVLVLLLWISIREGLDPLGGLTREIRRREPESLIPLDADRTPREVRPMVLALNQLLERMNRTLESERRFTANAAHELRTPLAAIQAQLHTARTALDDAERETAFSQLQRGVERGIRLVGQLLTLARLDPDQTLPDVAAVDLGQVAESVCAELAPLALRRDQTLELKIEPNLPTLPGNADMLSMLIGNVVDNAIRYTQNGGRIDIEIARRNDQLILRIGDNGPGIPAAQRKRVFERFYRLAAQDQPGTGLGLAICRRIAELHRAHIELSNPAEGTGLVVTISLPLAPAA